MNCEKCSTPMEYLVTDQTCSWKCPSCGWGIATTYYSPMVDDDTSYTISIHSSNKADIEKIRVLADVMNCNFLEARKHLQAGTLIPDQSAVSVCGILKRLYACGIAYSVSPDFLYDYH